MKIIGKLFTIYIISKRSSNNKTSTTQSRLYGWEHYYKLRRKFCYRKNNKPQKSMKISKTMEYLIIQPQFTKKKKKPKRKNRQTQN